MQKRLEFSGQLATLLSELKIWPSASTEPISSPAAFSTHIFDVILITDYKGYFHEPGGDSEIFNPGFRMSLPLTFITMGVGVGWMLKQEIQRKWRGRESYLGQNLTLAASSLCSLSK